MKQCFRLCAATAAIFLYPTHVRCETKGDKVLKRMEAVFTKAEDEKFSYDMVVGDINGETRRVSLKLAIKGEKRKIEFVGPGDVKGTRILVQSRDKMWVYLPAYKKIRRIANHAKNQTLYGADYSFDDLATVRYSRIYKAKILKDDSEKWVVECTLKKGAQSPYPRIVMTISKKLVQPTQLLFFNKAGKNIRTETRSNYSCQVDHCTPMTTKMVDHTRNDHWTRVERKGWSINNNLSSRDFSLRSLQRGH